MRKSVRRKAFVAVAAAAAVATAITATTLIPASADDTPGGAPDPDPVTSMTLDQIYSATGKVKLQKPGELNLPGFGGFNLGDDYQRQVQINAQQAQAKVLGWLEALGKAGDNVTSLFPDSTVDYGDPGDPIFENYKTEGGSATVESGGKDSSTSSEPGVNYNVAQQGDGTIKADYSAQATVQGTNTTVNGNWTFEAIGPGTSKSYGSIGIDSFSLLSPDGPTLKLSGYANMAGADDFSVQLGPTSYNVGATGTTKGGDSVGVSASVNADGSMNNLSFGAKVSVPGFPQPIQMRVDVSPSAVSGNAEAVPGITISASSNGAFRLTMDVNKFFPWFSGAVSGKK